MTIDNTEVTDGTIGVVYDGTSAKVTVAGNIAQYVTPIVSGAHVSIAQSDDLATEITYNLSGSSSDGEFYMSGSYKATIELNGLTLTNATPVNSGAAVHIQNGKRSSSASSICESVKRAVSSMAAAWPVKAANGAN